MLDMLSAIFNRKGKEKGKQNSTPDEVEPYPTLDKTPPAYDLSREQKHKFSETISIDSSGESDYVNITVDTPRKEINFDIRIIGHTSRFGTVDAKYITVGGFSVDVYYPTPDNEDKFMVRKLFYYDEDEGVGGEHQHTTERPPSDPDWIKGKDAQVVNLNKNSVYIEVYDWRENMITSGKPHPSKGQVVFRYQDSLNSGGNRKKIDTVLSTSSVTMLSHVYDLEFVAFDTDSGEYVTYATEKNGQIFEVRIPIKYNLREGDMEFNLVDSQPRISQVDNVIWVKDPKDTWMVEGIKY